MRKLLMVLMFVLFALPAFAQSKKVTFSEVTYLTAATADWSSTLYALKQNRPNSDFVYREGNPLYAGLSDRPVTLFIVGEAADVSFVLVMHKLLAKKQPKALVTGLYIASGIRFAVAARNAQQMQLTLYQHSF